MNDSSRRSDPEGSGGATRPLLMNARRYGDFTFDAVKNCLLSITYSCFGWVSMNNPG